MKNRIAIAICGLFIGLAALAWGWGACTLAMVLYVVSIIVMKKFMALSGAGKALTIIIVGLGICLVAGWH